MRLWIVFILAMCVYLLYRLYERQNNKLTDDVLNSMKSMSASLKDKNSIETAMEELSKGSDRASSLYRAVIEKMHQGMSLSEALEFVKKKYDSHVVSYLSKLVLLAEQSNQDIADELSEFSVRMNKLRENTKRLYASTAEHVMVLQVVVIIIMPTVALFLPEMLDLPIHQPLYYFMAFAVILYGSLDYLIYSDLKKTIFVMPVFITSYLLVITWLAPRVASLFANVW